MHGFTLRCSICKASTISGCSKFPGLDAKLTGVEPARVIQQLLARPRAQSQGVARLSAG